MKQHTINPTKPARGVCFFLYLHGMKSLALWMIFLAGFSTKVCGQDSIAAPVMGETIGKLPFLKYGLGKDRLGGAKMTYLDTGVVMLLVDSIGEDYKVKLSANHAAYIPKENLRIVPGKQPADYYLSSNWRVYGNDTTNFDYVTINLDERLPYRSSQRINPAQIVVDIFGVTSNTNWITQFNSVKEIKNTWYEQVEDDVMRVFIELKHAQHWGYTVFYDSSSSKLVIRVKRQPSKLHLQNVKIAIDAGHGGSNWGATGVRSGIKEKDYTLLIARELNTLLKRQKAITMMVRTADTTLEIADRAKMLLDWNPDLLISIHLNSSANAFIRGTSTYYRYIGFRSLSTAILKRMLELNLVEIGNTGSFNFGLNGPTAYPNCLVEVAYLSNWEDEQLILNEKFRKSVARKIAAGINDWLKKMK